MAADLSFPADGSFALRVIGVTHEAIGVISLQLAAADGRPLPPWTPGAHIDLQLPDGLTRQYSLCGDKDGATWRIAVLKQPLSRGGSRYLHDSVTAGDTILAAGPRNNFPLVDAERYLFIAGGIGITPILPMIADASARARPWTLVYGGRTRASMALLAAIAEHGSGHVQLVPHDEFGPIDLAQVLGGMAPGTHVYCCGPGALIDAVEASCLLWPPAGLHRERFAAGARSASAEDGAFTVELALSGRTVKVSSEQSLLGALEEAGCTITNSCRAGICGTCLVRVLDGTPDHRDDLLSDEQRASASMILPCVSRSRSSHLVLEI